MFIKNTEHILQVSSYILLALQIIYIFLPVGFMHPLTVSLSLSLPVVSHLPFGRWFMKLGVPEVNFIRPIIVFLRHS